MRRCAAALAVGLVVSLACGAQQGKNSASLERAKTTYNAALLKARIDHNEAVKKAAESHRQQLRALVDSETKAGNLDAAVLIREELKTIEADGPPTLPDTPDLSGSRVKWLPGTWTITYHPNKSVRTYLIRPNGEVNQVESRARTMLRAQGDSAILDFNDGRIERLTFAGGRVFVEHFNPKASIEKNLPDQVGIGEPAKKK